jgi:hypothetical protein
MEMQTSKEEMHTPKKTRPSNGTRITKGSGWDITATKGAKRTFKGTCLGTINIGPTRIALFKVPK